MTARTKDYKKVGSIVFQARICIHIPVDRMGNQGLDGIDEVSASSQEVSSLADAVAEVDRILNAAKIDPPPGEIAWAEIEEVHWTEDVYDDDEYGTVYDAIPISLHRWYMTIENNQITYTEDYDL